MSINREVVQVVNCSAKKRKKSFIITPAATLRMDDIEFYGHFIILKLIKCFFMRKILLPFNCSKFMWARDTQIKKKRNFINTIFRRHKIFHVSRVFSCVKEFLCSVRVLSCNP